MTGSLVADLGLSPRTWLFVSLLSCVTLFFKFGRVWSLRNLDLFLLFALAPGLMALVGTGGSRAWAAFAWLLGGSVLILIRCLLDLAATRRPLFEPNLSTSGLYCVILGVLGLLLTETLYLPRDEGVSRNPADPGAIPGRRGIPAPKGALDQNSPVNRIIRIMPVPFRRTPPQVILSRVLAMLAHLALVIGMILVCRRHFRLPMAGLASAACYLLLPYTRIALVDSGQLTSAALIVAALVFYRRPVVAAILLGVAASWIPACLGLLPLWAGFYYGKGARWFLFVSILVVLGCVLLSQVIPDLALWARALGARNLVDAGLRIRWGRVEFYENIGAPAGSYWTAIDPSYRLPVLILYLALVVLTFFWPREKGLGELIALSAALLVASQFWYLDAGGTLILLYLPLVLLMMFRPHVIPKRPILEIKFAHSTKPAAAPLAEFSR